MIKRMLFFLYLSTLLLCLTTNDIKAQRAKLTTDIWEFTKKSKRNHTVLSIWGFNKGDTLTLRIGDLTVFENWIVEDTAERYYDTDVHGNHWLFYYIIFSSNNKLKCMYNKGRISEFYRFPNKEGDDRLYPIVFLKNGKNIQGIQSQKMRWQRIDDNLIKEQSFFRGLD